VDRRGIPEGSPRSDELRISFRLSRQTLVFERGYIGSPGNEGLDILAIGAALVRGGMVCG